MGTANALFDFSQLAVGNRCTRVTSGAVSEVVVEHLHPAGNSGPGYDSWIVVREVGNDGAPGVWFSASTGLSQKPGSGLIVRRPFASGNRFRMLLKTELEDFVGNGGNDAHLSRVRVELAQLV